MNIKTLLLNIAIVGVALIDGCKKDDFTEIVGLCPIVISTNPTDGATGVPLNQIITVTFNKEMNPATIDLNSLTIIGISPVGGTISYSGLTATFTPGSLLQENTTYTGRVTRAVKDTVGNALQVDYVWTFTTGITMAPLVIITDPFGGETGVVLDKVISATFSMPMDPLTISEICFLIKNGSIAVEGTVSYSGNKATFIPTFSLDANTVYTGILTTRIKNTTGTSLASDYIWNFTTLALTPPTVISTDPFNNETNVALSKKISATFSVSMNPTSITNSNFTIKQGAVAIPGVVSYSGLTAVFTPTNPLLSNTTYTATISGAVKNLVGTLMGNDYTWIFSTGTIVVPTVISTDPSNNATGVLLDKIITATFSTQMNPLTINTSSFIIKEGSNIVQGSVSYLGTKATFIPINSLKPNTIYTGTITTSVKNLAGTSIANNYIWTFTTVNNIPPTVISTDPSNNATEVALSKIITAKFSVAMDPTSINASTFILRQGTSVINGTILYSGTTATFIPSANLKPNTLYTATITTGVKNVFGIAMAANYIWTFTTVTVPAPTVISTDPLNNATSVVLNKIIKANFSTQMDASTINTNSFTLKEGINVITGIVSYNGITASFSPSAALKSNTIYTATITTLAKNVAGVALAANYVWTFTTLTVSPPTVIVTDPLNNATGVPLNKIISAGFSTQMDPLTITNTTFTIKHNGISVLGVVTYAGTTATFTPSIPLIANTIYSGTITTGVKNTSGISLENDYIWSFTTLMLAPPMVTSTIPLNNEISVVYDQTLEANFNMPMDPLTINGTSFLLSYGNIPVSGTISYSGLKASFNPTNNLIPNTLYKATITTAVKNLAGVALVNDYVWTFTTKTSGGAPFVDLKSVARFGIIAGVGVSNNAGFSEIHDMDIGISPGVRSSVTGFPPGIVVNGAIYASDDVSPPGVAAMLIQAKNDLTAAYNFAKGASIPAPNVVSGDQGGKTLAPGIYKSNSSLLIANGDLTLDAQGDPNAVWIFQVASSFTTIGGAGGNIILSGGAQPNNVFWQVGSSATIGDFTSFQGNILALTSVTMNSGATAEGRMLCINGAIVLTSTNIINKP
ncbi:MAG: Ig-like domain-containing protein [Saprospiraceae bacterium]|nr:Ig-like domain-containing protein [Saprospiraceae bacterium]